jgi:hypothetical protein
MEDARARWEAVVERIKTGCSRRKAGYVADIREEIVYEIHPGNIVTRNRYGAEVLNSVDHLFLDIDSPPWSWRDILRRESSVGERQARIVEHVRSFAGAHALKGLGYRLYLTPRGVRVLVAGQDHSPRSPETKEMMKALHVDRLYMALCGRQDCYRARLTPKPSRIGIRTPKCVFPRDEASDRAIRDWVAQYRIASGRFAACRFVEAIGASAGSRVTEYHDQRCRAYEALPLA